MQRRQRVGIWAPVQYATAKIGATLVNINPAYRTREAEYAVRQSGTSVLAATSAFKASDDAATIRAVRPQLPGRRDRLPARGRGVPLRSPRASLT